MKILHGENLVKELRNLSDNVSKRLWIAVPYIGSPTSLRKILGKKWFDSPSVSVKLLTDISEISNINSESIRHFYERGKVKSLTGLHAKIYIIDDNCLVTSANLTNTAFSKRYEIGVLFQSKQANTLIETFNEWWLKSVNLKPEDIRIFFTKNHNSTDETEITLPTLWKLPNDPGSFIKNLEKRYLNYDRIVENFNDFANKYSTIQRLWKDSPLNLEIDGLFNYLYHHAVGKPSNEYIKKMPRNLSEDQQLSEIKKWALSYRKWNEQKDEDDIVWRIRNSEKLKKFFIPSKVTKLTKEELKEAFMCLNSLTSYPINRTKILNNNSIQEIRVAINELVNGDGELAARMDFCNKIKNLGTSSMNEIIGFTKPEKYPIINKNSNCGLRFFGYQVRVYN